MKSVSIFYNAKKIKPKRKSYETSQSGFLTFVFKESFHDLSLFWKVQSFWRNNSSVWMSYCEIARTFTLGQVISFFFLQLRSRGWGFNQLSPSSPQKGLIGFNHVRSRFGDFYTITAGSLRSVTQTFSPGFSTGRTEARCHQFYFFACLCLYFSSTFLNCSVSGHLVLISPEPTEV